jgi:hypothetical protein
VVLSTEYSGVTVKNCESTVEILAQMAWKNRILCWKRLENVAFMLEILAKSFSNGHGDER